VIDVAGQPDVVGALIVYSSAVSPGDSVAVSVPIDADTHFVRAVLYTGSITSPSFHGEARLAITEAAEQTLTLHVPATASVAADYFVGIAVCADEEACNSTGTGSAVAYGVTSTADTYLTRYIFHGSPAGSTTSTCLPAISVNVAAGNTAAPSGELDASLELDLTGNEYGADVAVQADGKVVALVETGIDIVVVRRNPDLSADEDFGSAGVVELDISGGNDHASALSLDSHGRILVAGHGTFDGVPQPFVVRLTADGALDSSFGVNGIAKIFSGRFAWANAIALDHSERIVIAGGAAPASGAAADDFDLFFARFTPSGEEDPDFGAAGMGYAIRDVDRPVTSDIDTYEEVYDIAIDEDDGIYYTGTFDLDRITPADPLRFPSRADRMLGRLDADGMTFGFPTSDFVLCMVGDVCDMLVSDTTDPDAGFGLTFDTEGRIAVVGRDGTQLRLERFQANSFPDPTFTTAFVTLDGPDVGTDVLALPEGRILVGGTTQSLWLGTWIWRAVPFLGNFALVQLDGDGSPDPAFGASGTGATISDFAGQLTRLARRPGATEIYAVGHGYNGSDYDLVIARYR
jgi:uncharacterized delta-60 repeat protein